MKQITSANAPKAVGPYSHAVEHNGLIELSGQIGVDPKTGLLVKGGIELETEQAFLNIRAILIDAGASMENVIKTRVYLTDMEDYETMNSVYSDHFLGIPPARVALAVRALPLNAKVEIECTAIMP